MLEKSKTKPTQSPRLGHQLQQELNVKMCLFYSIAFSRTTDIKGTLKSFFEIESLVFCG